MPLKVGRAEDNVVIVVVTPVWKIKAHCIQILVMSNFYIGQMRQNIDSNKYIKRNTPS